MKLKQSIFFILLLFIGTTIEAQKQNKHTIVSNDIDYYRATFFPADSLLKISKTMQKSLDPCKRIKGYNIEANMYYRIGDYKKSETLSLKALDLLKDPKRICEKTTKFNLLGRLFWIKKNTNKYNEALTYLILKEEFSSSLKKEGAEYYIRELSNASNKSLIKEILGFNDEAIKTLQSTLNSFDESQFTFTKKEKYAITLQKSSAYNILGTAYYNKGQSTIPDANLDSAFVYYKKAYDVAKTFNPPHEDSKPLYNLNRIKILVKQGCYQKALDLINTFTIRERSLTEKKYTFHKSVIHYNLQNTDSTLYFSDLYINDLKITPNTKKNRIIIYDMLAKEYHIINKPDSAYKYSELVLKDLNELDSSISKTNKAHYLYDFEKIKKENRSAINKANNKQIIVYILLSAIILFLGFIIYILRRKKLKKLESKQVNTAIEESLIKKKDYNIDKHLEKRIIKELNELENSTLFLNKDFSIIDLAKKMETNTSYLSFIINRNKNRTFKEYLLELRINYLIGKLKTDKKLRRYSIQSLGEEIGYTNASAFTRAFRKQMKCTPSTYIKNLKNS